MNNSDMPAMPVTTGQVYEVVSGCDDDGNTRASMGLTKREYFAAMAMQGLIAGGGTDPGMAAPRALEYADALLVEMEDQP